MIASASICRNFCLSLRIHGLRNSTNSKTPNFFMTKQQIRVTGVEKYYAGRRNFICIVWSNLRKPYNKLIRNCYCIKGIWYIEDEQILLILGFYMFVSEVHNTFVIQHSFEWNSFFCSLCSDFLWCTWCFILVDYKYSLCLNLEEISTFWV